MLFVSLLMFTACSKDSLKKVDFGGFSGLVPSNWQKTNLKGIDSNVSIVITDKNDTLVIDYGKFSDQFNEIVEVRSLERKAEFDSVNFHYPENMVFSENAEIDQAQGLYLEEYFFYETIDGKKAKLGFPKLNKNGRCLLHIANADNNGNKLSIYVHNVDERTQKEVYSFFKSITFKPSI
jgi:hypothetical protein